MKRIMKSMRIPRRKPGDATGLKEGYQTRNPNFFPAFAHAEIPPSPSPKKKKKKKKTKFRELQEWLLNWKNQRTRVSHVLKTL
jgi:hypothetical protein